MKKAKKVRGKKSRKRDEEIYEKIKSYKEEPLPADDVDDEISSVLSEDLDAEDDVKEKEDDF